MEFSVAEMRCLYSPRKRTVANIPWKVPTCWLQGAFRGSSRDKSFQFLGGRYWIVSSYPVADLWRRSETDAPVSIRKAGHDRMWAYQRDNLDRAQVCDAVPLLRPSEGDARSYSWTVSGGHSVPVWSTIPRSWPLPNTESGRSLLSLARTAGVSRGLLLRSLEIGKYRTFRGKNAGTHPQLAV